MVVSPSKEARLVGQTVSYKHQLSVTQRLAKRVSIAGIKHKAQRRTLLSLQLYSVRWKRRGDREMWTAWLWEGHHKNHQPDLLPGSFFFFDLRGLVSPRANHPLKGDHVRSQASMPKCKFAECAVGDYLAIKSRMRHKVKGSDVTRDTRAEHAWACCCRILACCSTFMHSTKAHREYKPDSSHDGISFKIWCNNESKLKYFFSFSPLRRGVGKGIT